VNNVKKNNLTKGAFALLLLASTTAGADQQYPAADFQPEVVYQDSDYIAKNSPAKTAKDTASTAKANSNTTASKEVDSKYPAADFQPEVLYHDPNYKPTQSVKATVSKEVVGSKQEESVNATAASKQDSSMSSYLIGLVVLALAGYYFFNIRGKATVHKKTQAAPPAKTSYALTTGVAKYLNKVSGTGVSRYIEKQVKSASATATTGVAKYMAKQAATPKTTAAKAATGVEKYMRDRG
jgi:hypothetical protein